MPHYGRSRPATIVAVLILIVSIAASTRVTVQSQTTRPTPVRSPSPSRADLDAFIETQRRWLHIPGLSVAVVHHGTIAMAKGYGLASVELGVSATAKTAYRIGSTSKQFLATAVVVLAQDGKLKLDDSVTTYVPEAPASWRPVTIRHLLTHTAGLPREVTAFDPFKNQPDMDIVQAAFAVPLAFTPGERWSYSNIGYYVLAEVVSRVTGRRWNHFIEARLLRPHGIDATTATTLSVIPHRATGYMPAEGGLRDAEAWLALRPSGAFVSTVLDLARWDIALSGDQLLTASSKAEMWRPVTLADGSRYGYGFGWFVDERAGHRRIRHDGGVPGFVSEIERFPDDQLTVIVLANLGNRELRDLATGIAERYVRGLRLPVEPGIADDDPEFSRRIREATTALAAGRVDKNLMTPALAERLQKDAEGAFAATLRALGPIQSMTLLERAPQGDGSYRYRLSYRYMTLFVACKRDAAGRVTEFAITD